ncbi:uncharacterized protein PODANS_6_9600 [Podospora anserina S mat+]|uniref:Podospora anserina S mat+ genomic DNA chromosome 6, supercontig 4 n=1 Tax=Podospora anserina (strain S / ATCC MYA-4624 / DSM 980 / FGSC 10383) TaxID=515849 RepID=B2ANN6_PODAN|nr:uncharacterized protein PODANS_6_9600 [Podospora anserina S mat+]CAP65458.1 unnamed protein product [Podospora anserina S mat+]CDP31454.1 Putative protein of unknown function [Podospora anserina S mat+]
MAEADLDPEGLDLEDPQAWISHNYREHLITKVEKWNPIWDQAPQADVFSYCISIAQLQRMRIQRLQIQLASAARKAYEGADTDSNWKDWDKTLSEYVSAVQEHDYMEQRGSGGRDPFLITGERYMDRKVLEQVMHGFQLSESTDSNPTGEPSLRVWQTTRRAPVPTRGDNRLKKLLARIGIAAIGTAFLIVPMWLLIWVVWEDTWVALWSTTIFVAVFGVLMACVLENEIAVLSASAAYAAVLVVFVALVAEQARGQDEKGS